jgi:pimeloyl-ACP methyl ester carboxylesterase
MPREPKIDVLGDRRAPARAVVLVLHGGREHGYAKARRGLAYLRTRRFGRALRKTGGGHGVAVWLLRYRYRGWNPPHEHPVADARWALEKIRATHGDVPVVLLGHSMGGRVAFRVAADPSVRAVCALAPWTETGEPVEQLAGRTVLIAHGDEERMTDPALSYSYALRAKQVTDRVCRFDVHGDGHAMLRRAADWTGLVCRFVLGELGVEPLHPAIANALAEPAPDGLRVPLAKGAR